MLAEADGVRPVAEEAVRIALTVGVRLADAAVVRREVRPGGLIAAVVVKLVEDHHIRAFRPGISGALDDEQALLLLRGT